MLGVSLIIIAAAIVYMVETYISTYYTIEYMHGTSLFLILLAKYGTPVLFLLLCAYIAYRNFLKKQKAAASAASERPTSKEELYTNKIQAAVKTKSVFSEQADQMLYQVRRFGQKMAVAYSMTQDSKTSGEQAKCLTLLESAERIGTRHSVNSSESRASWLKYIYLRGFSGCGKSNICCDFLWHREQLRSSTSGNTRQVAKQRCRGLSHRPAG